MSPAPSCGNENVFKSQGCPQSAFCCRCCKIFETFVEYFPPSTSPDTFSSEDLLIRSHSNYALSEQNTLLLSLGVPENVGQNAVSKYLVDDRG